MYATVFCDDFIILWTKVSGYTVTAALLVHLASRFHLETSRDASPLSGQRILLPFT